MYCLPETEAAHNFYRGHWANMPESEPILQQWVPKANILSFEEITRVIAIFAALGIEKVRLTGGETIMRRGIEHLTASVAKVPGITDLALTTNGFLFAQEGSCLAGSRVETSQLQPGFPRASQFQENDRTRQFK
jgi:cyclic pyranopterin phosphate synthase